jgi:hypothetical protein
MQRKRIVVSLTSPDYERLVAQACQEERAVDQQATYLIRQALAATPAPPDRETEYVAAN